MAVGNKDFPFVCGVLELIQVECNQIVEEETLNLSTEDVKLGAKNVQCVPIATGRTGTGRDGPRPLARS